MIQGILTYAQTRIYERIVNKMRPCLMSTSYEVHGDTYGDYLDEPYGDYYDTSSEEPR